MTLVKVPINARKGAGFRYFYRCMTIQGFEPVSGPGYAFPGNKMGAIPLDWYSLLKAGIFSLTISCMAC